LRVQECEESVLKDEQVFRGRGAAGVDCLEDVESRPAGEAAW
jgi:hypothetical protein